MNQLSLVAFHAACKSQSRGGKPVPAPFGFAYQLHPKVFGRNGFPRPVHICSVCRQFPPPSHYLVQTTFCVHTIFYAYAN
jgi:hypothetical protein